MLLQGTVQKKAHGTSKSKIHGLYTNICEEKSVFYFSVAHAQLQHMANPSKVKSYPYSLVLMELGLWILLILTTGITKVLSGQGLKDVMINALGPIHNCSSCITVKLGQNFTTI